LFVQFQLMAKKMNNYKLLSPALVIMDRLWVFIEAR